MKVMRWFVSCDYEWADSYEFATKAEARAWMIDHDQYGTMGMQGEPATEKGHNQFRVWRLEGTAKVITEHRVELSVVPETLKDI